MSRTHSGSVHVARPPEQVWAVVSDVTRTGEWSPVCRACWWDDGDGPRVGAHFTGRNETPERVWETRCQVVAAEPGRSFAWVVGEGWVRWAYDLAPEDGGTRLTESWEFTDAGLARFTERYGDDAPREVEERTRAAHAGIPATLAAVQRVVEQG